MSPDGAYVVCGSESGELLFWGRDGKPVLPPAVPQALVVCHVGQDLKI